VNFEQTIQSLAAAALPVVLSVTLAEAAKGWRANKLGDMTGASLGRLTFNPANHVDIWGTVVIPAVMYLVSAGNFLFAYAKPIPINYSTMPDPKWGMLRTEGEGLWAFALQALVWIALSIVLQGMGIHEQFFVKMVMAGILVNTLLFAFVLLPIPPMPAGKMLVALLPYRQASVLAKVEPYGFWIVLGLALIGFLGPIWIKPISSALINIIYFVLMPLSSLFS
jgi:Zn-dependent protease